MKRTFTFFILSSLFFVFGQNTAKYNIIFTSEWDNTTHPHPSDNFPTSSAHWSRLVGTTHNSNYTMYTVGTLASAGIKNVAENGVNSPIFNEIDNEIANGNAFARIQGSGLGSGTGQIVISDVTVSEDFPLLSLVSMIAPSPDWFIGIKDISLLDNSGSWINVITLDVYPMDAGTDSAPDYVHTNTPTNPAQNIQSYQNVSPFSNNRMGTIRIELAGVLGTTDTNKTAEIKFYPNPVKDFLNIESQEGIQLVEVFSATGKLVFTKEFKNSEKNSSIDVSNLNSGIYFLRIKLDNDTQIDKKFIVE